VAVDLPDRFGKPLEAAFLVGHPPQLFALSRKRFPRGVHVPILPVSPLEIPIQPEAVSQEVERFALPAQVHHAGFLPVDFQRVMRPPSRPKPAGAIQKVRFEKLEVAVHFPL
jgi:hypothetical protein